MFDVQSLANNSGMTLHIRLLEGADSEDIVVAAARAVGQALRMGIQYDNRRAGKIASSKGVL
jgi:imidazoleglycerol-phosphate dehydratase